MNNGKITKHTPIEPAGLHFNQPWWLRVFVGVIVFLLPLAFLSWNAWGSDRIRFLPGLFNSDWMFFPTDAGYPSKTIFSKAFTNMSSGEDLSPLHLTVFGELVIVKLNGEPLLTRLQQINRNPLLDDYLSEHFADVEIHRAWKRGFSYEISELVLPGENHLEVFVYNGLGRPGLLIRSPGELRPADQWSVSDTESGAAHRPGGKWHKVEKEITLSKLPVWPLISWMIVVYLVVVLALVFFSLRHKPFAEHGEMQAEGSRTTHRVGRVAFWIILAAFLSVNLWNAYVIPPTHGPDSVEHQEYLAIVAEEWRIPDRTEVRMAYQPPMFYVIGAAILNVTQTVHLEEGRFKLIQVVNVLIATGLLLIVWWACRLQRASVRVSLVVLIAAAFLPGFLYIIPRVTNEVFTATIIALGITLAIRVFGRAEISNGHVTVLAVTATVALLTKFTAIFMVTAIAGGLLMRIVAKRDKRSVRQLALYALIVGVGAGWYYLGNVINYGTLFPGIGRAEGEQQFLMLPTFRFPEFYLYFGSVFFSHVEQAKWISFWDGMYASFWSDGGKAFFAGWMTRVQTLMNVTLVLAILPTAAVITGFLSTCRNSLLKNTPSLPDQFMLAVLVWTWCGLIYFTLQTASYTTMKAFYILSLLPIFGVMLIRGRRAMDQRLRGLGLAIDIIVVVIALITIYIFRWNAVRA